MGPEICISNKFRGEAGPAGPETALRDSQRTELEFQTKG